MSLNYYKLCIKRIQNQDITRMTIKEIDENLIQINKLCDDLLKLDLSDSNDEIEIIINNVTVWQDKARGERNNRPTLTNTINQSIQKPSDPIKGWAKESIKFNGELPQWFEFWDSFKIAIDENPSLSQPQKFLYLKNALDDETKMLINGLPLSDENYKKAKDILTSKLNNPNIQLNYIKTEMAKLEPVTSINASSLRYNLTLMTALHRRATAHNLAEYFVNSEMKNTFFSLIPKELAIRWHKLARTCDDLLTEFSNYVTDLELLEQDTCKGNDSKYVQISTQNKVPNKCLLCGNGHRTIFCIEGTSQERKQLAFQKKLCFICLNPHHQTQQCKSKYRCKFCEKRHSAVICTYVPKTVNSINEDDLKNADSDLVA